MSLVGTAKLNIMICKDCEKGKIVLHAFSMGVCEKCECEVTTSHIPCDKLCEECSETHNCCRECGCDIEE